MTSEERRNFLIRWNNNFPVDRWWRVKHNIPFMSSAHREINFLDQLLEFEEDQLFDEMLASQKEENKYVPNIGEFLKQKSPEEMTPEERQEAWIREAREELANLPSDI